MKKKREGEKEKKRETEGKRKGEIKVTEDNILYLKMTKVSIF